MATAITPANKRNEVDAFLKQARASITGPGARGRLIFALDATASRQPTWDTACHLQAEMFREVATIAPLDIQLVYYRGAATCRASRWISDAQTLARLMTRIQCEGGWTQIVKVLTHARCENEKQRVSTLVFVGDAMEEKIDDLCHAANLLRDVPAFMFQEGDDRKVEQAFRKIAQLTRGAYCRFDAGSASQLKELLRAAAVYATGGLQALSASHSAGAVKLIGQLSAK
jgi:hypothetical protein